ncbi:substrate-binding domain-containing protein [Desulfogranum japonicum]|uniref:substrate-binding domain-containing protein n=1 Tax=Desulfogranum japonicum TaxID=231447 RepID=UPI00040191AB|nr:substrate-binding domain-containing protein [Desulfogranum japonicum]
MKLCKLFFITLAAISLSTGLATAEDKVLKMSTTTSTQASGLLDVLLPALEKDTGIQIKVIAKGTGAAIRDGMDGNVDVIFVHDTAREEKFVAEGYGTKRYAVMHNDFVIVGPAADTAGIKGLHDGPAAMKKIAAAKATFISRGDDSGTHSKEQKLWKASGVETQTTDFTITKKGKTVTISALRPADSAEWYLSIGQGMGKTLTMADEKQAYTMADRGTYIKYKYGRDIPIELEVLCEGGDDLANPYGVIPVNPEKHSHVKADLAKEFAEWITSEKGQTVINNYKLHGQQLFYPDAM